MAATCLLRDHNVTPFAWSGNQVLAMRIAEKTVADTRLYPLVYDFFTSGESMEGTMLVLPGCSKKMADELANGLNHFFHSSNPLIGKKLWSSHDDQFAIYTSRDTMGHVFYRNLKRGEMEGIPLILVINKEYKSIENKISKDRDRNAFGGDLMKLFYSIFARSGLKRQSNGIKVAIEASKPCWASGHGLLHAIADTAGYRSTLLSSADAENIFGSRYYARCRSRNGLKQLSYEEIETKWQEEGRTSLPGYFTSFGVISAEKHYENMEKKASKESIAQNSRVPTSAEVKSINVLKRIIRNICPGITGVFEKSDTTYTVAKTEAILGELRKGRSYHSHEVFLAEEVFMSDFSEGVAVFIHEHAHVFGRDGSRSFTDALTQVLAVAIRERDVFDSFEVEWEKARAQVRLEREQRVNNLEDNELQTLLTSLDESELRDLLGMVPSTTLKGVLVQSAVA